MEKLLEKLAELIAEKVIEELKVSNETNKELEDLSPLILNTKDASEFYKVHINTIRSWIKKGEINSRRIGNRLYVEISENKTLKSRNYVK